MPKSHAIKPHLQLCHAVTASAAMRKHRVVYIDTSNSFSPQRILNFCGIKVAFPSLQQVLAWLSRPYHQNHLSPCMHKLQARHAALTLPSPPTRNMIPVQAISCHELRTSEFSTWWTWYKRWRPFAGFVCTFPLLLLRPCINSGVSASDRTAVLTFVPH